MSKIKERIVSELYDWTFTSEAKSDSSLAECADLMIDIICNNISLFVKENSNVKENISIRELNNYLLNLKEGK